MTLAAESLDGRRLRRHQNREAVLDALMAMFREASYSPSTGEVAERAGISPRSLFRYFDDAEDLHRAAIARAHEAALPLLDPAVEADAPTSVKIRRLVEARAALFETIGPAARAGRVLAHRHPIIAEELRQSRAFLRNQVRALFARELARADVLPAADALCSFETYDLLRSAQGLSRARAVASLVTALTALLDPEGARR